MAKITNPRGPAKVVISRDPRVPSPEQVKALQIAGLKTREIAEALSLSVDQTRRLLTAANRNSIADFARDYMAKTFVPKILANIELALDNDPRAELSLELMKNMGLSIESAPPSGPQDETFEQFRMTLTKRIRTNELPPDSHPVIDVAPVDSADLPALAPAAPRELPEGSQEPASDSRGGEEGSGHERQAFNAAPVTP